MIKSAEADIVCPTVSTEDPLALLSGIILILKEVLSGFLLSSGKLSAFKSGDKRLGGSVVRAGILEGVKISLNLLSNSGILKSKSVLSKSCADLSVREEHTEAELRVILKQRV